MRPSELRQLIADVGDVTLSELPCGSCRVITDVEFLEEVEAWPIAKVCSSCADEIRADDADPRTGEPECDCRGFCPRCVGGV